MESSVNIRSTFAVIKKMIAIHCMQRAIILDLGTTTARVTSDGTVMATLAMISTSALASRAKMEVLAQNPRVNPAFTQKAQSANRKNSVCHLQILTDVPVLLVLPMGCAILVLTRPGVLLPVMVLILATI